MICTNPVCDICPFYDVCEDKKKKKKEGQQ